ncbi:MAG TPA: hypothetical protein VFX17_03175 [Patescibacteria group bacterium]|nr:hypothetical protein [Patescibacteria group bacterium]
MDAILNSESAAKIPGFIAQAIYNAALDRVVVRGPGVDILHIWYGSLTLYKDVNLVSEEERYTGFEIEGVRNLYRHLNESFNQESVNVEKLLDALEQVLPGMAMEVQLSRLIYKSLGQPAVCLG